MRRKEKKKKNIMLPSHYFIGLAVAQHNLGCALLVEKKEVWKAVEYWKMAADQNFGFSNVSKEVR